MTNDQMMNEISPILDQIKAQAESIITRGKA